MSIETHIDDALARVERERTHVEAERRAYECFRSDVASLSPQPAAAQPRGTPAAAGSLSVSGRSGSKPAKTDTRRVRESFSETVRPYSVADLDGEESLLETVREELGEPVAFALAPETDAELTPQIQRTICSTARQRRRELDAMSSALDRERGSLEAALDDCRSVTERVTELNRTSLLELGFPELRERHEQLSSHRDRCEDRLYARQETVQATTSRDARTGLEHRSLVTYLYRELPVSYPVLSTMVRLDSVLTDCQRTVRDHLIRRV